jgi:16S rRNA (guanine527-N7)-methyltransferase
MKHLSGPAFRDATGVSRETFDKLSLYVDLLIRWQDHTNLVSRGSLNDVWSRHVFDSIQIYPHLLDKNVITLDFGSGAGFPGLVLAIMGVPNVVLIESNKKKCSFLKEVVRQTDCEAEVFVGRVQEYRPPTLAKYITSRALASLESLLLMSYPLLHEGGSCLFLKGESYEQELTQAKKRWNMDVQTHSSNAKDLETSDAIHKLSSYGVLLEIRNFSPREK